MTKELVKSENGHKTIKHAMHDRSHSLLSGSRIKMRFASLWLVLLFLTAVSCEATSSTEFQPSVPLPATEKITEDGQSKPSSTTDKTVFADNGPRNDAQFEEAKNDNSDPAKEKAVSLEELLLFESIINEGGKVIDEINEKNYNYDRGVEKNDNSGANSETPVESKINADFIDIRRQGEIKPENKQVESGTDVQFDDSKQESTTDSPPRFGQRSRKPKRKYQDGAPVLQLTQGGYDRPFKRPRYRSRLLSRPDSSEQSSRIQEPDRNSATNRQPEIRQILPGVTYTSSPQSQNIYGPRPVLSSAFLGPGRNMLAVNHVVPPRSQNGFLSTPSAGLADYTNAAFQAQFPQNNEADGFTDFANLNNAALYQATPRNPFQTPGFLYQAAPQMQAQPVLIDPTRNSQPQLQRNPFATYPGFENLNDNSRLNYAAYFGNPTLNAPLQVPQNFYGNVPANRVNAFNNPPVTFISNYPQADDRLSPQFFRHPVLSEVPNNFQNSNDQQVDSDASQEEKKTKIEEQGASNPTNRNDSPSAPFGSRILGQNGADVYMRYPTNEAGYAIEENLPSQNNSDESKDSSQQNSSEQRNLSNVDPYRNALNSIQYNQKINNTFDFPPELFRDQIDFGYHRPQPDIFIPFPDRNRVTSRHPPTNIESRNPFDPVPSFPENYQFLNAENQRYGHRESDEIPSCAKQENVSVCFEDSEYPGNDILYSLNSNSFLADRLAGPDVQLTSVVLVEGNSSDNEQNSENYACAADIKYGAPLRAKNLAGNWKVIVNIQGKLLQPVRMEICKYRGDPCSYVDSKTKTTCVQKYNLQRLLTYGPGRGIHSDVFKIPVACSCQIVQAAKA